MPIIADKDRLFHLVSLGCPKNRVDSERIASVMMEAGFKLSDDPEIADVVIVNTCSFIVPAVEESLDTIFDLRHENPRAFLVVAGCLPLRYGTGLDLELPEVNLYLEPGNIAALPGMIAAAKRGRPERPAPHTVEAPSIPASRALSTTGFAYLKVSEGCSRRCSYCTIPSIRGPLESMDPDVLVQEAEFLADRGAREIVLVAQDLTAYGKDRGDASALVKLLRRLDRVEGIRWIRLMYLYPEGISSALPGVINGSDKVLPYLDVPFQHISEPVLRSMGRPWRGDRPRKLVEQLRREIPGLVLRTTFIVGFPTETRTEFSRLKEFIEETRIEHVGVFTYSAEEGTGAAKLGDPVPEDEKRARADEVREIHHRHAHERNLVRVGAYEQALVEGIAAETDLLLQARTRDQAPEVDGVTYITAGTGIPGEMQNLRITGCHGPDLFGELASASEAARAEGPPALLDPRLPDPAGQAGPHR